MSEDEPFQSPMPVNEPPQVLFTISPGVPVAGQNTIFDASKSRDIGGRIESYLWDFGDGSKTGKMSEPMANHNFHEGVHCTVILTVEDDEGAVNISSKKIIVNNPPQANFTVTPQHPAVGDLVKFDASESYDAEDGRKLEYYWAINNNSATFEGVSPPRQPFDEKGMNWINLTVRDKSGAEGHKNVHLKINQPPIPHIALCSPRFTLGEMINFSGETSEDLDGEIVGYIWDFGDDSPADYNNSAMHNYHDGGNKTVKLLVTDNDGAISDVSQEIFINTPPIAKFSINPKQPNKGESITFDASASSDPDGSIKRYMWDFGVGKAEPEVYYSEFVEHIYSRLQEYRVSLTVEDDKGARNSTSQVVEIKDINTKATLNSLNADKQSPQEMGAAVIWTAVATDTDNDPLEFQFHMDGNVVQDWSASSSWSWTSDKTGTHVIEAKVRDGKHNSDGDSSRSAVFEIVPPANIAPTLTALTPDKESPQVTGTVVTWTAVATDPESDPLEYQFALDGNAAQDWSASPTWSWTADQVGTHTIEVKIRDGQHDPNGDSSQSASFEIVVRSPNYAPVLTDLSPDKLSPQEIGAIIAWTAVATDPESDPLEFQFALDGNVTQDWLSSPTWSWNADQAGMHTIEVKARDADHPEGTGAQGASFEIVLPPNQAPILSSLLPDKESPQQTGSTVTWTASAEDLEGDPISYRFLLNGTPVSDWQTEGQWFWTAGEPGTSTVTVQAKDSQHDGPQGEAGNMSGEFSFVANLPRIEPANEPDITDLEEIFCARVEPGNPSIRYEALRLVSMYPGDFTIEQVSAIYDYLKANWRYVTDPRGIDSFNYANESLHGGKQTGHSGVGDVDDFAILISSLVESIGGTTKFILYEDPSAGYHILAQVYLGRTDANADEVEEVLNWLRAEYDVEHINFNIDFMTNECWLDLDLRADYPGESLPLGHKSYAIDCSNDRIKTPIGMPSLPADLRPLANDNQSEILPLTPSFAISPAAPKAGEVVTFDASGSKGPIQYYEWSFGDLSRGDKAVVNHIFTKEGTYEVFLTLTDINGEKRIKSMNISVS